MKHSQYVSGRGKTWAKWSNNKGRTNKSHNQQIINNKANGNVDTKVNNGFHPIYGKCICLCNKGCGFNTSHTTGFHDT